MQKLHIIAFAMRANGSICMHFIPRAVRRGPTLRAGRYQKVDNKGNNSPQLGKEVFFVRNRGVFHGRVWLADEEDRALWVQSTREQWSCSRFL